MDLVIPPTIYVAGPGLNDPNLNRSSRAPIKAPPGAEPATPPSREARTKNAAATAALPATVGPKGQLIKPTGTGTQLDVQA